MKSPDTYLPILHQQDDMMTVMCMTKFKLMKHLLGSIKLSSKLMTSQNETERVALLKFEWKMNKSLCFLLMTSKHYKYDATGLSQYTNYNLSVSLYFDFSVAARLNSRECL